MSDIDCNNENSKIVTILILIDGFLQLNMTVEKEQPAIRSQSLF